MPVNSRRVLVVVACFAVVAIGLAAVVPVRRFFAQQSAIQAKQRFQKGIDEDIKRLGGKVGFGPSIQQGMFEDREIDGITLIHAKPDDDLLTRLSKLTSIRRLNLEHADVDDSVGAHLAPLINLHWLSLAGTRVGDATVKQLAGLTQLRTLLLQETQITDSAIEPLAQLVGLTSLDISGTAITPAGATSLNRLKLLKTLTLDDKCITEETVAALASIKDLEVLEVRIASGLGRVTRDILTGKLDLQVEGVDPQGHRIWNADARWEETLAGVVDIVSSEVQLSAEEQARFVEAIRSHEYSRRVVGNYREDPPGEEIHSFDEFIAALRTTKGRTTNLRNYAKNKFTKEDVPKMLDAMRRAMDDPAQDRVVRAGAFLTAHYAIEDPQVRQQFEGMLADSKNRGRVMYAFDPWGFDHGERWETSEELADFAVPRLLACVDTATELEATTLSDVLGHLAQSFPKHAPEVLRLFTRFLREGRLRYLNNHLPRIVEGNPEAALAVLKELRRMLVNAHTEAPTFIYNPEMPRGQVERFYRRNLILAICTIGRFSSESQEIAHELLEQLRSGESELESYTMREAFSLLATGNHPETTRMLVRELLEIHNESNRDIAIQAGNILADVSRAIRDRRFPEPK